MPPIIEELDARDSDLDARLQALLDEHDRQPKRLLEAVFCFLSQRTAFFDDPDASKVLARLLRDVKRASSAPAQPAAHARPAAPAPARPAAPAPTPAPAPSASAAAPPTAGPSSSQAAAGPSTSAADASEDEEPKSKGLKPNAGNGATHDRYSWSQTLADVAVVVPVPKGTKGRECDVQITKTSLKVGLKGQAPILEGPLCKPVKAEDCLWSLDNGAVELTLAKADGMAWWASVLQGEPEIDTSQVMPENSKLSDLDGETRATVEKMMFDQRQKQLGLPTSEEAQKQAMLQKFMAAHPEMDFSKAKFS